jgi:glycine C-acetyltransferase/8-amino-7-oxononanoate synthase
MGYGDSPVYGDLEQEAQLFFGAECISYFPTGYLGMLILAVGLSERYEHIFIDGATHYCGWDGARLTGKPITGFRHNDPGALAQACRRDLGPGQRPLVLSDGVFPVSGALAPVPEYLEIVQEYDGLICLDDAHGSGVLGHRGRGTLDHYRIDSASCHSAHTLSKALGGYGGVIAGSQQLMKELEHHSRVRLGASSPPLPTAAAAAQALKLARSEPERRERLWSHVARARKGLRGLGWQVPDTPVPIICLESQPGMDMREFQATLLDRDICIAYVPLYSDTPEGGALRIAIFATHTAEQIDRLLHEMARLL